METEKEIKEAARKKALNDAVGAAVASAIKEQATALQATNNMAGILSDGQGPGIRRNQAPVEPGIGAARIIRCLGAAKGDVEKAVRIATKAQSGVWKDDLGDNVVRSMQAGSEEDGGFLIDPEFSNEIIEFLYNRSVFRKANPQVVDMPSGTMSIRKQSSSVQANYVGESSPIPNSQAKGGMINLVAKKLTAMVPTSNELLEFSASSGNRADTFIRNDIVNRLSVREDQAFLRGTGTESTPKGVRNWALASQITASNGATSAQIEQDFTDLWLQLENANINFDRLAFFMSPLVKSKLFTVRDGAGGNLLFPDIRGTAPNIWDVPAFTTNNIPANLGGGTESEIYLVNMADAILGETGSLVIDVDPSASYTVDGTLVSAFENDETLIRAKTKHDMVMRHEEAIAVKTGVDY